MGLLQRTLIAVAFIGIALANSTPDPIQLLHRVSENYRHLRSFEFAGHIITTIPGSEIQVRLETVDAEADHSFVPQNSSLVKYAESRVFRKVTFADINGNPAEPKLAIGPPGRWGSFDRIDVGTKIVTELPSEILKVDGVPVQCRVVQVTYGDEILYPEETSVKYWIDEDRLLVLKKQFAEHQGPQHPTVFWQWVYTVDSIKLNQPPPQWLIESSNQPAVDHARPEWVGRTAPDFVLPDLAGQQIGLSSMRGSVIVLDFWATYCGPCKQELPVLDKVGEDYKSKSVQVWGISFDDEPSVIEKWMAANHVKFRTMIDPEAKTADQYEIHGIPAIVVIGRSGKVVSHYDGTQPEESLRSAIDLALGEKAANSK
jgi:peroxiredoxin